MHIKDSYKRLDSLWGKIDHQHNTMISTQLLGKRILDIGSGFGALSNFLQTNGFDVTGIESHEESYAESQKLFPKSTILSIDLSEYTTSELFDTIILKDTFHHLYGETDINKTFKKINSLLKTNGRIVVWDPNLTIILRICRVLARHIDPEAPAEEAQKVLVQNGYTIKLISYYETIGLPLSGGYVGIRFIPNFIWINAIVSGLNDMLSRLLLSLGMGKHLCWRYLVVADKVT